MFISIHVHCLSNKKKVTTSNVLWLVFNRTLSIYVCREHYFIEIPITCLRFNVWHLFVSGLQMFSVRIVSEKQKLFKFKNLMQVTNTG